MKRIVLCSGLTFFLCLSAHAAWLGAALDSRPDAEPSGAVVRGVAEASPAARAGLMEGDVIVALQARAIRRPDELVQQVRAAAAGSRVRLSLLRNGKPLALTVVLAQAPADPQAAAPVPRVNPVAAHGAMPGLPRGGVPMAVKQEGHCSAYVPNGWSLQSNPQASAADLVSPDHRAYAGWGGRAVDRTMERFYGPLHGDPETAAAFMAGQALHKILGDDGAMRYTSAPQNFLGYFTLRRFETARSHGLLFYRAYPGMTQQNYVGSTYFAIADKSLGASGLMVASGVATSIRCRTQLVPQRDPGTRTGRGGKRAGCGGEGSLRGYNKELGHQSAHSSSGENFLLDATQWRENGPQGAGYYKQNGNFEEKLELGRSDDDC